MKIHKYIIGLVAALSLSSCHIASYQTGVFYTFDSYDELKEDLLFYAEDNQTLYFSNISLENSYNVSSIEYYYGGIVSKYGGLINLYVEETELDMSTVNISFLYSFLDEQIYKAYISYSFVTTEKNIDNLLIDESTITTDEHYDFGFDEIETSVNYNICSYSDTEPENAMFACSVYVCFLTHDIDNQIIIAKEFGEIVIDNITITTITK